jgi:glutathione S-transferase
MTIWLTLIAFVVGVVWFLYEKSRRRSHPVSGGVDRSQTLPHQAPFELYSNSFSHCSRKTRLAMDELKIDYQYHPIDLIETGWYQTISPQYLKVNPSGLLPTLVHEGHPVYESDDILSYAQSAAGTDAPKLVPQDPGLKATMDKWLAFCAIESGNPMGSMASKAGACIPGLTMPLFITAIRYIPLQRIMVGFLFHSDKQRPAFFSAAKFLGLRTLMSIKPLRRVVHASRDHMCRHLLTLNEQLAITEGRWILGENYSLADISIGCLLLRLEETGWLIYFEKTLKIDELRDYYHKLKARPNWQTAIVNHGHPIIEQAKLDLANMTARDPELYQRVYSGETPGGVT